MSRREGHGYNTGGNDFPWRVTTRETVGDGFSLVAFGQGEPCRICLAPLESGCAVVK